MASFPAILSACSLLCLLAQNVFPQAPAADGNLPFKLTSDPASHFSFDGFAGERIQAMVDHWLLPTPNANPGMLEMFRLRDREPKPNLVPWAGEFVGKYLISGIQTLRLTENPQLKTSLTGVVKELISTQAEDGYLGPFPRAERLRGHWDLWGHYHCMLALLMWHEATGDKAALNCVRKSADLVCATYLNTDRRAIDAGSDEMNLAISHSLGWLYRLTNEPRYLKMMFEIEKDWERAGDYFRKGLEGIEFYRSPRPRWESLHNLQALVEFYQITGDARYRQAFEHHWRSIARFDLRNTGGFSSGEQATGNPYAPTAIETCCSIAWMCVSLDMLKITGDPRVADKLELATLNAWAGAQHPSGRWCTYSTPMDGARQASAHEIVFQARPGTPELNCCSVNGPRGWGMLSEWATMRTQDGIVQNWLGPCTVETKLAHGNNVKLHITGNYPREPELALTVESQNAEEFTLYLRIPQWATGTSASLNGQQLPHPKAGAYLVLRRSWKQEDKLLVKLGFGLRAVPGDKEMRGKVSLYRGPLLLAWDQRFDQAHEEKSLPTLSVDKLKVSDVSSGLLPTAAYEKGLAPLVLLTVTDAHGVALPMCDFASAGAAGTRYKSWLSATNTPALLATTRWPSDGAVLPYGTAQFRHKTQREFENDAYELQISEQEDFDSLILTQAASQTGTPIALDRRFPEGQWYYWRVIHQTRRGDITDTVPPARFRLDRGLAAVPAPAPAVHHRGPEAELISAELRDSPVANIGTWKRTDGWKTAQAPNGAEGIQLDGLGQKLIYSVNEWPEDDYSVSVCFRIDQFPRNRLGQIISSWCRGSDDPLRLVVDGGKLYARVEAGSAYSTAGVPISTNEWHHAAVVKQGTRLTLYLDGIERGATTVPEEIQTKAKHIALGGNPHFTGNEHLSVSLRAFSFYEKALRPETVRSLYLKAGLR